MLGWRYEIEDLCQANTRLLSGKIDQNISGQVLWGKDSSLDKRNAKISGQEIQDSGIPNFILIEEPENIKTAQDVFDKMEKIKEYANVHTEMRAAFMSQYYRYDSKKEIWRTEGNQRHFAVWVKWQIINGQLNGIPILDEPLEKVSSYAKNNLLECLKQLGINKLPDYFDIEHLRGKVNEKISKG